MDCLDPERSAHRWPESALRSFESAAVTNIRVRLESRSANPAKNQKFAEAEGQPA